MGYTTDFIGHVDVTPSLNDQEIAYLTAFSESRRCVRDGGPYAVPGNPRAESYADFERDRYNATALGQPGLWCDWVPCWDGCCLAFNGNEKFYDPVRWLRYLIAHFLKPRAAASGTGLACFAGFTFDHVVEGMVVGCRRDNKELYAIVARNNRVTERVLRPADQRYVDRPPLPYEAAIDRQVESSPRRRRRRRDGLDPVMPIPP
ncbi:MAG: hypothetical protein ACJ8H8_29280 [Geminicoccaceae bacterium]